MAAGAELNHWCFCQLMQIQCVGSARVLASSPPTAECVFLSLWLLFFSSSLSHVSFFFFRMCMPENGKGPHVFLFNTVTNPVFASVCVCHTAFWKFKPSRSGTQARLTLWPTWGLKRRSFSLLSVYQHNAAHRDKWRQLLWYRMGSFGAWIINIFMRPFHSLCGALCCYGHWQPAAALITQGGESVTALCRLLWSAASMQNPGHNVLFMRNNQDLTSERVLKWYLWRGLSSAWKGFWKHLNNEKKYIKVLSFF